MIDKITIDRKVIELLIEKLTTDKTVIKLLMELLIEVLSNYFDNRAIYRAIDRKFIELLTERLIDKLSKDRKVY